MSFLSPSASTAQPASENGYTPKSFQSWRWVFLAAILLAVVAIGAFYFSSVQAQTDDGAIPGLTLTSDTPGTLTVSWDTPSPAPSDYRLRWAQAESDYPSWKDDNETDRGNAYPAGDATSLTLSGLSQGADFKVQVRARYNDGDAPWSGSWASSSLRVSGDAQEEEATPTPEPTATPDPTPVPGAINGLTLGSETPGILTVSWDTPSPAPSDYRLRWAQAESDYPSWKDDNETDRGNAYPAGGDTSLTLSGLTEGTEYKVQVRARYNDGAHKDKPWGGPWTEEVRGQPSEESAGSGVKGATDDPAAPAAPFIVGSAVSPDGQVTLLWLDPSDDTITGYQVLRGPDADSLVVIEEDTGSSGTSYTDTSPPPGRTHTYAVKARNAAGLSPPSGTVTATVPDAEEEEELITAPQHQIEVPSVVAVGNLGSPATTSGTAGGNFPGMTVATAFTTGSRAEGYNLTGVGLQLSADDGVTVSVSIFSDSSGQPGTSLQVLANPPDLDQDINTIEVFASAGYTLAADTTYWVVVEHTGRLGGYMRALTASSVNPDDGSLPGWSIGANRFRHKATDDWKNYPQRMAIEVRAGELGGFTLDSVAVTSKPLDSDTYKAGENLELLFTFSTPVQYVKGVAALYLNGSWRGARYMNGSGTEYLRYWYRVQSGDSGTDGFAIGPQPLAATTEASILTFAGSPVTLELAAVQSGPAHKVNGGEKGCLYVFCTDVEVGLIGTDVVGAVYYSESSARGGLSNRLFRYGSANYQVRQLLVRRNTGQLELLLDRAPAADLLAEATLHIGTRFFHFNDATLAPNHRLTWANSELTWNVDDQIRVSLQDNMLVSNFVSDGTIGDSIISTSARAQAFTTGPRANGYRITEVRLKVGAQSNTTPRIAIHSDNAGRPGTRLLTLTNPAAIATATTAASFTSPGLLLRPDTRYWAVVDRASGSGEVTVNTSTFNGENDGSAAGWSIADSSYQGNGANWSEQAGQVLQIAIEGRESTGFSSAPAFPDHDRNDAADPIAFTVAENLPVNARVGVVGATDADHDPLTYSAPGTDATSFGRAFALDAATGAITVKSPLDYDAKTSYSVVIQVADGRDDSGATESTPAPDDTVRVTIYVRKVADPVMVPPIADLAEKVLVSNYAIETEHPVMARRVTISTSGIAARPNQHENLDSYTRAGMSFRTGPDTEGYELGVVRLPLLNGNARNIPQVSIWSHSSAGNPHVRLHTLVGSRDLDQLDNDFYSDGFVLSPDTTYWVVVENVHDNNSRLDVDGLFYHEPTEGNLNPPDEDSMTAEGWSVVGWVKNYYSGEGLWCTKLFLPSDGCSNPVGIRRMKFALFEPLDASAPFFRNADGNGKADPVLFSVPENTAPGASVGQIVVHNFDDDVLTFAVSGDSSLFDSKFRLNQRTGEITLKPNERLDYETQRKAYIFDVTVHDGEDSEGTAESAPMIDDVTTVTINVTNVNEPGVLSLTTDTPAIGEQMVATLTDEDQSLISTYWVWSCSTQSGLLSRPGTSVSEYTPQSEDAGKQCSVSVQYQDASLEYQWLSLPFWPRAE